MTRGWIMSDVSSEHARLDADFHKFLIRAMNRWIAVVSGASLVCSLFLLPYLWSSLPQGFYWGTAAIVAIVFWCQLLALVFLVALPGLVFCLKFGFDFRVCALLITAVATLFVILEGLALRWIPFTGAS